jgi:hypothetical protein
MVNVLLTGLLCIECQLNATLLYNILFNIKDNILSNIMYNL